MAAPKSAVWKLEPHTAAKHAILHRYLSAWVPILSQGGFQKIVYIDAFAGPGCYSDGEQGSPILALRAVLEQKNPINAEINFHFIELDKERAEVLELEIKKIIPPSGRSNIKIHIHRDSFEASYDRIRPDLISSKILPTFAFIDPFGWTGMPASIVENILKRPSSEVFINFMFEEINRFLSHPDQTKNYDLLFGSENWRTCESLTGSDRNNCIRACYEKMLRSHAKYVRYFEMRNFRSATDYFLFFATNSLHGLKKMKEAMWKVDGLGDFSFSDATDVHQSVLFNEPSYGMLERQILSAFSGRTVSVEQLEEYVITDTAFRETHLRKPVLGPLEAAGKISVQGKVGRRAGTFPAGTKIVFP